MSIIRVLPNRSPILIPHKMVALSLAQLLYGTNIVDHTPKCLLVGRGRCIDIIMNVMDITLMVLTVHKGFRFSKKSLAVAPLRVLYE